MTDDEKFALINGRLAALEALLATTLAHLSLQFDDAELLATQICKDAIATLDSGRARAPEAAQGQADIAIQSCERIETSLLRMVHRMLDTREH